MPRKKQYPRIRRITLPPHLHLNDDLIEEIAEIMVKAAQHYNMPIIIGIDGNYLTAYPRETVAQIVARLKVYQSL